MIGAIRLLPYNFMAWTGKTVPFHDDNNDDNNNNNNNDNNNNNNISRPRHNIHSKKLYKHKYYNAFRSFCCYFAFNTELEYHKRPPEENQCLGK
jgi:hypothetical protein